METKKVTGGTQGSWYAKVDGIEFPCAHEWWWVKPSRGLYHDKLLGRSEYNDGFVERIRSAKKVILTGSIPFSERNPLPLKRDGYIALWSVDDIEFDEDGLRFRFVERLCNLT